MCRAIDKAVNELDESDPNAMIIDPAEQARKRQIRKELEAANASSKMNPKKKKRLEKYIVSVCNNNNY